MSRTPDVRLGIVSYGTPEDLETCLQSVPAAISGLHAEVVVFDNGSVSGHDSAVAQRFPVRLMRCASNVGYPRAMNQALADTSAPFLIALNPDTLPRPGSLTHLVEKLDREADIGLVGPRLVGVEGHLQHSAYAFPSPAVSLATGFVPPRYRGRWFGERFWLEGHARLHGPSDVDWILGAVHAIRRAAVRRQRVYSERSFMYAEDMELCAHLRRSGCRVVFDPSTEVMHVGNVSGERSFGAQREFRWLDANYDWFVADHGEAAARRWATANVAGLLAKRGMLSMSSNREHRQYVSALMSFHARRILRPRGDLHSRFAPDGQPPADPVIAFDSGHSKPGPSVQPRA